MLIGPLLLTLHSLKWHWSSCATFRHRQIHCSFVNSGCMFRPVPLAQDLINAPTSQAFVEHIFSVYDLLTEGCRNRMTKLLKMRAFLCLNAMLTLPRDSDMVTLCVAVRTFCTYWLLKCVNFIFFITRCELKLKLRAPNWTRTIEVKNHWKINLLLHVRRKDACMFTSTQQLSCKRLEN